jgi:ParB family chromosome partitioning protein
MSRKVLGKGLEALIPQSSTVPAHAAAINDATTEVALDRIDTNPRQPRKHFDTERLQGLSQSISEDGVLQPVVVRRRGDRYELIMGERRMQAARLAGMTQVPVVVKDDVRDVDLLRLALVENIQRENLNPIEVGLAYKQLVAEFSLAQADLARMVGRDRSSVANSIRLLNLPEEVQQMVAEEKLSGGHAKALLALPTQKEQLALGRRIVETGMSVRDAEKAVGLVKPSMAKKTREPKERPAYLLDLEKTMGSHLGTRVQIAEKRGGSGKITIEFYSHEDFERLASLMEIPLPR